ncbi:hypothetical protein [Halorientalis litorea]|jgi:hypothetical protein|uniref:hypothetical protein n=1 Tax=Halorientalis litorea TaxID=2931977 RepID=UPI001FF23936|nr:hypothetical protein [Halorientalis litorea]
MPGRASDSSVLQYLGALVAVVAVVGYVGFGWRFESADGPLPVAIAAVCVAVALGYTLLRRRTE